MATQEITGLVVNGVPYEANLNFILPPEMIANALAQKYFEARKMPGAKAAARERLRLVIEAAHDAAVWPLFECIVYGRAQAGLCGSVCRSCKCTDDDCSGCILRTGRPCYWVSQNLCSACADGEQQGP